MFLPMFPTIHYGDAELVTDRRYQWQGAELEGS